MTRVGVIVPTVRGREADLHRCIRSYQNAAAVAGVAVSFYVLADLPTCGIAWQRGMELAGHAHDFMHLTADDLAADASALQSAIRACREGILPAPVVRTANGLIQSAGGYGDGQLCTDVVHRSHTSWCAIPFFPTPAWQQIGPMIPLHYYTDDWYSHRAIDAGHTFQVRDTYSFTHYDATPGRGAGMTQSERAFNDRRDFHRYISGEITP